jgi:hypothetical protein
MFSVVFAFLMVASAWLSLRSNPSYSGRFALRALLGSALAIGAVVLLIVAAVDLSIDLSVPVVVGTVMAVSALGALLLAVAIDRFSTPPEARLGDAVPASVEVVHLHRNRLVPWATVLAGLAAGSALLGLIVPDPLKVMLYLLAGLTLYVAVIVLPFKYATARRYDRALTALEAAPWVHWHYTPEQWQAWVELQFARAMAVPPTFVARRAWKILPIPCAAIAVGVYATGQGSRLFQSLFVLATCGAVVGLTLAAVRAQRREPARLRARRLAAAPDAYFGRDGVFCDAVFMTWLGRDTYLVSATIDRTEPANLLLRFEKTVIGSGKPMPVDQRVLIPAGAEADLARLQAELSARCPKARVALR